MFIPSTIQFKIQPPFCICITRNCLNFGIRSKLEVPWMGVMRVKLYLHPHPIFSCSFNNSYKFSLLFSLPTARLVSSWWAGSLPDNIEGDSVFSSHTFPPGWIAVKPSISPGFAEVLIIRVICFHP